MDWAFKKAQSLMCDGPRKDAHGFERGTIVHVPHEGMVDDIAQALREARNQGIEEVAEYARYHGSGGFFIAGIRALKESV